VYPACRRIPAPKKSTLSRGDMPDTLLNVRRLMRSQVRKRLTVIILVTVFCLAVATFSFLSSREPTYEGRPISYWLDQLPATYLESGGQLNVSYLGDVSRKASDSEAERERIFKDAQTARKAVAAFGTNYLDALVKRIAGESPIKSRLRYWGLRLQILKPVPYGPNERHPNDRRAQALTALLDLRAQAKPIAPKLAALTRHQDLAVRAIALRALQSVSFEEFRRIRDEDKTP
jgi:hypothetical protein